MTNGRDRLASPVLRGQREPDGRAVMRARYESFGGIVCWKEPPALLYVDKDFMRELGYAGSPLWDRESSILTAPTEVHLSITNSCPMRCRHCYTDSRAAAEGELPTGAIKRTLRHLADAGVFHVALGGGEPFVRPACLGIARHCRELGLVPNITTNGFYMTETLARECSVFGQVNVSLDGVSGFDGSLRGQDGFAVADRALRLLRACREQVGINCVLTRHNYGRIPELVEYASRLGLSDILFLRFKPAGRARPLYEDSRLTHEQGQGLVPRLLGFAGRTKVRLHVDCSFAPLVYCHGPDPSRCDFLSFLGCVGGDVLAGITPAGQLSACSFCSDAAGPADRMSELWHASPHLGSFRDWPARATEPCRSCRYLNTCRGGCHVVAEHVSGDFHAPDPECPRVIAFRRERSLHG